MKTQIQAYFNDFNAGAKKDVIKLEIRGKLTDEQIVKLHKLKGNEVFVSLASGQMEIDDYEQNDHEGIQYKVNSDGSVDVPPAQVTIDEVTAAVDTDKAAETVADTDRKQSEESEPEPEQEQEQEQEQGPQQEPSTESSSDNVADITQERKKRGRSKKEDEQKEQPEVPTSEGGLPPLGEGDKRMPF
ncbi:hypothetical protein [Paenibacillus sp. 481]|uniref:hypothetical protein n=1 Tax=Paenibacillus sp. 481 TaxID=2835869 RepID=UPI001E40212A|nr:hypothetical protein [Paenibacillus sp. 481]UHA74419.1 hypothetical protein KIK04_04745 [Paenibacillus sp. 481]